MQKRIENKTDEGTRAPDTEGDGDGDEPIATVPLDPQDSELRKWFVAESRRLQSERAGLGMHVPNRSDESR